MTYSLLGCFILRHTITEPFSKEPYKRIVFKLIVTIQNKNFPGHISGHCILPALIRLGPSVSNLVPAIHDGH
jgi:hypothetical protein